MPETRHPYPYATASLSETAAQLSIGGASRDVTAPDLVQVRVAVLEEVRRVSAELGRTIPLHTQEPAGEEWDFLIHADGTVVEDDNPPQVQRPAWRPAAAKSQPERTANGIDVASDPSAADGHMRLRAVPASTNIPTTTWPPQPVLSPSDAVVGAAGLPNSQAAVPAPGQVDQHGSHTQPSARPVTFLPDQSSPQPRRATIPPPSGLDQFLARLGIKTLPAGPTPEEIQDEADTLTVSRQWPGARTVAIVNGKGGPGKTPTAALLAAVYARYGGGNVICWDNNDTRGSLGWRTQTAGHDSTVLDLIPAAARLMEPTARIGELAAYTHHQAADRYDVLRSNPELLSQEQRLTTDQFRAVHDVATHFYRLAIIDSGNDESSYAYLNMLDAADLVVVVVNATNVASESARLLLHDLRDRGGHYAHLADTAVVAVSLHQPSKAAKIPALVDHFSQIVGANAVATIPYDPRIDDDDHLLAFDGLQLSTQRAFRRLGAVVSDRLQQPQGANK